VVQTVQIYSSLVFIVVADDPPTTAAHTIIDLAAAVVPPVTISSSPSESQAQFIPCLLFIVTMASTLVEWKNSTFAKANWST
jgi:hypothetical protein